MDEIQSMQTGLLLQTVRETLMRLGKTPTDKALARRADALLVEVDRRISW